MTGQGKLPPPRPDQGGLRQTPGTVAAGARLQRVANLMSQQQLGVPSQPPTAFYTFASAGRIWAAHLSFAVGTNNTYAGVTQLYARVKTLSGITLLIVELAVAAPNATANGDADLAIPGVQVQAGDKLQLDVNNGTSLGTGGVMHASCVVLFSIP